jgi:hypothetical protein
MGGFDSTIAFAGRLSQTDRVRNIDATAAVTDNSSLLQRMGNDGNRVALHAKSPAPDFLRMALELSASRCLCKPFTPVALLTVINECLSEAQSRLPGVVQLR